jgi:hypothetical protein
MAAAFSDDQEMDAIHLAFTGGYEKGFSDALRTLSLASGLSSPGRLADTAGGLLESGTWDQAIPRRLDRSPTSDIVSRLTSVSRD